MDLIETEHFFQKKVRISAQTGTVWRELQWPYAILVWVPFQLANSLVENLELAFPLLLFQLTNMPNTVRGAHFCANVCISY